MSEALKEAPVRPLNNDFLSSIPLELKVEDRDTIQALEQYAEGAERDDFALEALKIGVLALKHAAGAIDADFIQRETTRLVETLDQQFDSHARETHERLSGSLKDYFDPKDGRFSQRVKQLTSDDGDLSRMLKDMIDGENSRLAKTLLSHFGKDSPLMKTLSPDQSQGLLAVLRNNVDEQLTQQSKQLLGEFSLDNREGALYRLMDQITNKNDNFTKNMQLNINEVVKEFSLDEENSALSRLVKKVDSAQEKITQEFSLDNEQSALHKLKDELTTILSAHVKTNANFQEEVKVALGKLVTKRDTEKKGTQHGFSFEDALFELVSCDAQKRGDIADNTSNCTGLISRCLKGDFVLQIGADSLAAGARIVLEAKQDASYTLAKALAELEEAKKNRDAQLGVFVFSRRTAPAELESLARYGSDLVVVWDAENPASDAYLRAALEIARALCLRTQQATRRQTTDFTVVDKAVLKIEKAVQNLDQIRTSAQTIKSSSEKILKRVDLDQQTLDKQLEILRESLDDLKQSFETEGGKEV